MSRQSASALVLSSGSGECGEQSTPEHRDSMEHSRTDGDLGTISSEATKDEPLLPAADNAHVVEVGKPDTAPLDLETDIEDEAGPRKDGGEIPAAEEAPPTGWRKAWRAVRSFLAKYWFLLGLGLAIGLAAAWPDLGKKNGYLQAQYVVKYCAVILIFLLTGLTLKSQVLGSALLMWKPQLLTLAISLGFIPLVGWGIGSALLLTPLNPALASGIIVAASMPTTVSSNVVMTKQADGNDAAAVVGAVLGNIIGIFVSPMLILGFVHVSAPPPYSKLFLDLSITVLIPLILGQAVRFFFPKFPPWLQTYVNISNFNNCMILLMVWSTFCDTFAANLSMAAWEIFVVVAVDVGLYVGFSAAVVFGSFYVLRKLLLPFARADAIATMFVGATKTIALGIPLINIIWGSDPNAGLYAAPLLIYHAAQLLVGALIVPFLRAWKRRGDPPPALADTEKGLLEGKAALDEVEVAGGQDVAMESVPAGPAAPTEAEHGAERVDGSLKAT
ncbi:SBF-like CPA transporter family-domain-containing protein [Hyaloraphidium curvatum]|nr:SBF-like CPA transporter family-domain-containing protein [Hyaloraphidium curvatum]